MRVSIKQLKERINTINCYTNYKYNIKLWATTGCGVDLKINEEWQSDLLNNGKKFTNKEAMQLLDKKFNKEIRKIILEQ